MDIVGVDGVKRALEAVEYSLPIDQQHAAFGLEKDLQQAVHAVFQAQLQASVQDMMDYGTAYIASKQVVERFVKQDGLVLLRRSGIDADNLVRIIYANWVSKIVPDTGDKSHISFWTFIFLISSSMVVTAINIKRKA